MSDNKLLIDYQNIYDYIEDKTPYIFVDRAEIVPGESGFGYKNFTMNEWFFPVHLPNNPLVPAAFQLEAMTQLAGLVMQAKKDELKTTTIYVKKYSNIDLYEPVRPGDRLYIEANILKFRRGIIDSSGVTYTLKNGEKNIHSKADFQMVMPDILHSLSPIK